MTDKRLTGKVPREAIGPLEVPRPPDGLIDAFRTLGDATSTISDAMDELGLPRGIIPGSELRPTIPDTVIVGPALTVRNVAQRDDAGRGAKSRASKMGEI